MRRFHKGGTQGSGGGGGGGDGGFPLSIRDCNNFLFNNLGLRFGHSKSKCNFLVSEKVALIKETSQNIFSRQCDQ